MTRIHNTADDPMSGMLVLLDAMSSPTRDGSGAIEAMEKAGQVQLVNSDRLPTASYSPDEEFIALGFTFGSADAHDPLFRPATLPDGWKREGSDHAMHSYLLDQYGRRRVGVFYKAAFYDRRADMSLISRSGYLQTCVHDGTAPVLDDEWLTADSAREALEQMIAGAEQRAVECDELAASSGNDYWAGRATEHRADAAKAKALADRLPS